MLELFSVIFAGTKEIWIRSASAAKRVILIGDKR